MGCKECKITCDGKEMAVINCTEDGINIKCTDECKDLCTRFFGKEGKENKGCC